MAEKKAVKNRPEHPFKYLASGYTNPKKQNNLQEYDTPAQKNILNHLKKGARLIFDIKEKRGLIYNFKKGINAILEVTVKMLSDLIKKGYIKIARKEGKVIHYVWAEEPLDWFLPEGGL